MLHTCLLGHPFYLDRHPLPGLSSSRNWPLFSCVTPPISSLAANLSLKWNIRKEASLLCCEHTCTNSQTLWVPDASLPAGLGEGLEAFICQISGTWEPCRDFSWSRVHGNSMCVLNRLSHVWPHGLQPARLLCPRDSPGKNTGVGCHALLQGILLTQGSNPSLLHCRQILYRLSHPLTTRPQQNRNKRKSDLFS